MVDVAAQDRWLEAMHVASMPPEPLPMPPRVRPDRSWLPRVRGQESRKAYKAMRKKEFSKQAMKKKKEKQKNKEQKSKQEG